MGRLRVRERLPPQRKAGAMALRQRHLPWAPHPGGGRLPQPGVTQRTAGTLTKRLPPTACSRLQRQEDKLKPRRQSWGPDRAGNTVSPASQTSQCFPNSSHQGFLSHPCPTGFLPGVKPSQEEGRGKEGRQTRLISCSMGELVLCYTWVFQPTSPTGNPEPGPLLVRQEQRDVVGA